MRFLTKFYDPAFEAQKPDLERIAAVARKAYDEYHKSPRTPAAPDRNFTIPLANSGGRGATQMIAEAQQMGLATLRGSAVPATALGIQPPSKNVNVAAGTV